MFPVALIGNYLVEIEENVTLYKPYTNKAKCLKIAWRKDEDFSVLLSSF